ATHGDLRSDPPQPVAQIDGPGHGCICRRARLQHSDWSDRVPPARTDEGLIQGGDRRQELPHPERTNEGDHLSALPRLPPAAPPHTRADLPRPCRDLPVGPRLLPGARAPDRHTRPALLRPAVHVRVRTALGAGGQHDRERAGAPLDPDAARPPGPPAALAEGTELRPDRGLRVFYTPSVDR